MVICRTPICLEPSYSLIFSGISSHISACSCINNSLVLKVHHLLEGVEKLRNFYFDLLRMRETLGMLACLRIIDNSMTLFCLLNGLFSQSLCAMKFTCIFLNTK
ncbi:hypothetical protein HHI36_005925 [Cryptolaemus montrouzieri]|uniref:Uncharacterized protein n=1 Tax=Cryptolaemus montrouzieri TaxID=559131 RepID=A0ABD2NW62_9CUCU